MADSKMNNGAHSSEYKALKVELDKSCELFKEMISAERELFDEKVRGLVATDANLKEATILAIEGIKEHQRAANNLQAQMRQQETDNAARLERYVPLGEYNVYHKKLEADIKELQLAKAESEGKSSKAITISYIMAILFVASIAISILLHFVH